MANVLKNTAAMEVIAKMYLNEELADVHFVFKVDDDVEKIPANKGILAALSPVFYTMFFGSLKEGNEVKMVDASAEAFKEFLQFFYLGEVNLTMENIETVVRLADKYDVVKYVNACATFLKSQRKNDHLCWGYQLAVNLNDKELIEFYEDKIMQWPKEVFATDAFHRCDKSILKRILDLDLTCNEVEVFDACLIWAKNACKQLSLDETQSVNLRIKLSDCLKQIRFGVMNVNEFNQRYILYKGLFSLEEFEDIMLSITVNEYEPKIFNKIPRLEYKHTWDAGKILQCERKTWNADPVKYVQTSEVTSFSSNHLLLLGEIRTVYTFNNSTIIKGEIEVIITERENLTFDSSATPVIIYRGTTVKWGGECYKQLMVTLPHPILIQPQRMYEIRLNIQSTGNGYYYSDCKQMVEMGDGIKIQFYRNQTLNYDNLSNGWLSVFLFNNNSN